MKVERLVLLFGVMAPCAACFAPTQVVTSVDAITPATLYAGTTTQVTITGDFWAGASTNFGSGTQVQVDDTFTAALGSTPLSNVTYLDAQTLQAQLPADAKVGLYALTITGPNGSTATLENAATVLPAICQLHLCSGGFTAAITLNPTQGPPGTRFDAVASATASTTTGNRVIYLWDWTSDGHFDAYGPKASHTFRTAGTYTITLVVADELGNAGQSQIDVVVTP